MKLHQKLNFQLFPDGWCKFSSILFVTPDWGWDKGLPGLPSDCVRRVRLHFQTQPLHQTREVPGRAGGLGPSRKGNQSGLLLLSYGWKRERHSQRRIKILICDIIKMEMLEPLHRQQIAVWFVDPENIYILMNEFYSVELLSVLKQKMLVHLQRIYISAVTVCLRCRIKFTLCGPALYFTSSASLGESR